MPLVLTTAAIPGTAYWAPATPPGLEHWSENGAGDLYPNVDNTQTLGLTTNRVEALIGRTGMLLGNGAGPLPTFTAGQAAQAIVGRLPGSVYSQLTAASGLLVGSVECAVPYYGVLSVDAYSLVAGQVFMEDYRSSTVSAGNGSLDRGSAFALGGTHTPVDGFASRLAASGAGAQAQGFVRSAPYYDAFILASGSGASAEGAIGPTEAGFTAGMGGYIYANGVAAHASGLLHRSIGAFRWAGYIQATAGSTARGVVANMGTISSSNHGAHAEGSVSYGTISATGRGGRAGGVALGTYPYGLGSVLASGEGSFTHGVASLVGAYSGAVEATGVGSWAGGNARGGFDQYPSLIRASSYGSIAFGLAVLGSVIHASGMGSGAFGRADDYYQGIAATANSSFQFGQGTNAVATSLQVGGYDYATTYNTGVRLIGSGVAGTRDGDIWVDGATGDVYVRSGGVARNMSNIP